MRTSNKYDDGGYSVAFSWWRHSTCHILGFTVVDHTSFYGGSGVHRAVMDDFGNLVKAGK